MFEVVYKTNSQTDACPCFRVFCMKYNSCLILFAGIEEKSTMISYRLGEQLSSGQRVEVNIPLIETSWTSNENSLIDQMQFQSKCSLKDLKLILHSVKKIFVVVCFIVIVMYSRL